MRVLHAILESLREKQWDRLHSIIATAEVFAFGQRQEAAAFTALCSAQLGDAETIETLVRAEADGSDGATRAVATVRRLNGNGRNAPRRFSLVVRSDGMRVTHFSVGDGERLHIGCGPESFFPRLLRDWVNLDREYDAPRFGRVELLEPWPFADASVLAVYSEDFLEHFDQREQLLLIGEAFRVLQPGGILRTTCPALSEHIVRRRLFPRWPETGIAAADRTVEWPEWGHHLLPTREYLTTILRLAGFTCVETRAPGASSIPGFPGDHRPLTDREVADELYVEAVKPL